MVDVSARSRRPARVARAQRDVRFPRAVAARCAPPAAHGEGPVIVDTAIIAGTMAVKRTHELIPFCHPLPIERCRIAIDWQAATRSSIECTLPSTHRTGVEMEALTGATVAALTVYDMCKALSHGIVIEALRLTGKSGGKGDYAAGAAP